MLEKEIELIWQPEKKEYRDRALGRATVEGGGLRTNIHQ